MIIWKFWKKNIVVLLSSVAQLLVVSFCLINIYDDFMSTIFKIGFEVTIAKTILQGVECGGIFLIKCYKIFGTIILSQPHFG
jgi:hypothetical protein